MGARLNLSKSLIDKAGRALAGQISVSEEQLLEFEYYFDEYRKSHLQPLSEITLELQGWLQGYGDSYYIAQRLKRKPQISRKLKRLSARLTQLQDIGGCRIIVARNRDVDRLRDFIRQQLAGGGGFTLLRETDYRERGRDDSGYRALHLMLQRDGRTVELQLRSKIQHHWAEGIERTSVIYGRHLKEGDGDSAVIGYFKSLSDLFYEIEAGRTPGTAEKLAVERARVRSEEIVKSSDAGKVLSSYVNDDIMRTMTEKESRNPSGLNNWIIVFDWNTGNFVSWDIVGRAPDDAVSAYVDYEAKFPADAGFEVVMIGSSNVATVRRTHSHYFGIADSERAIEGLDDLVLGFSGQLDMDVGARQILACMVRKKYWGKKSILASTLKNHHCQNVLGFDSSLQVLVDKGLVLMPSAQDPVSLNVKKRAEIDTYL